MGRLVTLHIAFDRYERLWVKSDEIITLTGYRSPLLYIHDSAMCTWSDLSATETWPSSTLFINEMGVHNLLSNTRVHQSSILQRWFVEEIVPMARRALILNDTFGYIYVVHTPQLIGTYQIFTTDNIEHQLHELKTIHNSEWRILQKFECENRLRMLQDIFLVISRYRVSSTVFSLGSVEQANYICNAAYIELLKQRALYQPNDGIYINNDSMSKNLKNSSK